MLLASKQEGSVSYWNILMIEKTADCTLRFKLERASTIHQLQGSLFLSPPHLVILPLVTLRYCSLPVTDRREESLCK